MSSRIPRLTLAAVLFSSCALHAEEQPAPPVTKYELKNRSSFTPVSEQARAPFWPIGWVKRKKGAVVAETQTAPSALLEDKHFKVTSILLGNPSLAVINGRAYSEGEFLRTPKAKSGEIASSTLARVRVQRIADGSVVLQHQDQTIIASLQRTPLAPHKAEEVLLEE